MSSAGVKRKLTMPLDDKESSKRGREVASEHAGGARGRGEPGMGPREGSLGKSLGRGRGDWRPPRNSFREGGRVSRDLGRGRGRGRGEGRGNGAIFGRGEGRGRGGSRGRGAAFGRGDGRERGRDGGRGAAFGRGGGRGRRGDGGGRATSGRGDGRGRGFTAGYRTRGEGGRGNKDEVEAPPPESLHKYTRGPGNSTSNFIEDRKLRSKLKKTEKKFHQASRDAAAAELLLPAEAGFLEAEGMEETFKFTQDEIKASVDLNTAKEVFELKLPDLGPYALDYTRNGRFLVLGGRLGHLALLDALRMDMRMEVQLGETIRDVKALHNENFVAVAQKKYAYIYDSQGAEVHCLRNHVEPHRLEFLPYHFLLASIGRTGYLKYTDVSTGQTVAEMGSKLGACDCLRANPHNAILHAGHHNGVVTMWTPAMGSPVLSMLAHPAAISTLAVDKTGHYMVTSGMDKKSRVWDLRTYKELHSYTHQMAPADMDISDRGLLSLGFGCHVQVWKDAMRTKAKAPYMEHELPSMSINRCRFRPLQDVLALGHSDGFSSMVVPGAGEPNFDTFEANPFQNAKQRREAEVVSLLEKLPPETIALDPSFVGKVDQDPAANVEEVRGVMKEADPLTRKEVKEKKKTRGRSKLASKLRKKQKNVVDAGVKKLREKLEGEKSREKKVQEQKTREEQAKTAPAALARFFRK